MLITGKCQGENRDSIMYDSQDMTAVPGSIIDDGIVLYGCAELL